MTVDKDFADIAEKVRGYIAQSRDAHRDRGFTKGMVFGRWERELGTDRLLEIFVDAWPKIKLRLSAKDFVFLRDMKISLGPQ